MASANGHFYLRGEIDAASAPAVQAALNDALADDMDLLVDCTDLTFIDSSGIAVLVRTQQMLAARGHRLRIVKARATIERLFQVTGLTDLLHPDPGTDLSDSG
jgi:anti-sigma B factor antagonist